MNERKNMGERDMINYFFQLYLNSCLCEKRMSLWEKKKNSFTHKIILKKSIKKKLRTAYEAVVSCAKQTLNNSKYL
jgi:hypothetical protein